MNPVTPNEVAAARERISALRQEVAKSFLGSARPLESMTVALLARGHVLLEGVPGVAKTTLVKAFAAALGCATRRIQFTPDLLPADITGTYVFSPKDGTFTLRAGPVFANVVLADEINRAPAKSQSALLEAMQERQVTIGPNSFPLPDPFLVTATMNPLDSDGTYALPLAQMDRFLMKILVAYPSAEEELAIVGRFGGAPPAMAIGTATPADLLRWRDEARAIFVDARIARYAVALVHATRAPHPYLDRGASPRASLALVATARARALVEGRSFVVPDDVRASALPVLRHRLAFNYRTLTESVDPESITQALVAGVAVP